MEQYEVIETKALSMLEQGKAIIVNTSEQYEAAGQYILDCKRLIREAESYFKPIKQAQDAAKRVTLDQEKRAIEPLKTGIGYAESAAIPWKQEQDRKQAQENARIEAERRAAAEEARLKEAEIYEKFGDTEAAEQALDQAVTPLRPVKFESPVPKVSGLSTRKQWRARILDPGKVTRAYCEPDVTKINFRVKGFLAYAKPTPENIAKLQEEIGGIEIFEEEIFQGRRA